MLAVKPPIVSMFVQENHSEIWLVRLPVLTVSAAEKSKGYSIFLDARLKVVTSVCGFSKYLSNEVFFWHIRFRCLLSFLKGLCIEAECP